MARSGLPGSFEGKECRNRAMSVQKGAYRPVAGRGKGRSHRSPLSVRKPSAPAIRCQSPLPAPQKGGMMPNPKKSGLSDNSIGALAYVTPAPAFFFLAVRRYNKRPYVRFHAWQSIVFQAFVFLFGWALELCPAVYEVSWASCPRDSVVCFLPGRFPLMAVVRGRRVGWQAMAAPAHWGLGR